MNALNARLKSRGNNAKKNRRPGKNDSNLEARGPFRGPGTRNEGRRKPENDRKHKRVFALLNHQLLKGAFTMKINFTNFSRSQLQLLHDNIEEALLNDFKSYCLTIYVDEPYNINTYTVQNIEGLSNTNVDLDC